MEVVDLSMPKYPNRDALREANDIYLDAMYQFVSECLGKVQGTTAKKLITDALRWSSQDDIEEKIEIRDIAHLVRTYWYDSFEEQFEAIDRYYEARSAIGLIVEGRNRASHRPWDLDPEFTRTQLFLIAELLGKINKPNEHREVKAIRDKLFPNDTKEHLLKVEAENAKYQKSLEEAEKHLETVEVEKREYENNKKELSQQILDNALKIETTSKRLEEARSETDKYKKNLTGTKRRLEKSEAAQANYKERLQTTSKELKDTKNKLAAVEAERTDHKKHLETISEELESVKVERRTFEERLTATSNELASVQVEKNASEKYLTVARNLLTTVAIDDQTVFPSLSTDATVRIFDRRGTNKSTYLLELLEQKKPTIIYVQSEEKIDQLLKLVGSEKAEIIGKYDEQTSEAEETEILEKLERGELSAVISNTTFSMLTSTHYLEHFVFCHIVPGLDEFFKRCQPAFTSKKNTYLHLIYNNEKDIEGLDQLLAQKYPNEEELRRSYRELKKLATANGGFVKLEEVYNALDMVEMGIETGLAIFEELGFLERDGKGIITPFLSPVPRELEESEIYRNGEELKKETAEFRTFQLEYSIDQIWERILEKLNIDSEQILREGNIRKKYFKTPEKDSDMQPITETERSEITPPTPDMWPQRGMSAFNALRQRAANNFATVNTTLQTVNEPSTADLDWESPVLEAEELESPLFEDREDYQNKYNLALQFAEEYGITALEEGIAQLIRDQNDPTYDFMEDERNMLRAFQDAFWNFRIQSKQFAEAIENDSTIAKEDVEVGSVPKPANANAKVTEEQVKEIRSRSATGESYSGLAKEFGLTPTGIRNIVLRNTWKHVE